MSAEKLVHIVDDDDSVRRSVAFMLKHAGYRVESHISGVEFLKSIKLAERGCVLLDVCMPQINGLEVQQEMAARGIDMPVIILTGHGDIAGAVRRCAQAPSILSKSLMRKKICSMRLKRH